MTPNVTTSTNIGTIATNTAVATSTAATVTRRAKSEACFDMTCVLIPLIFIFVIVSVGVYSIANYPANPDVKSRYGVQVNSTSFLSVSNISYPQIITEFNMVFSFRNVGPRANYSLMLATMYLHHDHKYLSDRGLPAFVLKRNEEKQVKAKFGLSDNLLARDLAGGEVNAEAELMVDIVFGNSYMEQVIGIAGIKGANRIDLLDLETYDLTIRVALGEMQMTTLIRRPLQDAALDVLFSKEIGKGML